MSFVISDTLREMLPTGDGFSQHLGAISHGISAESLLRQDTPASGSIITLPQFGLSQFNGSSVLNRIQWQGGRTVIVAADDERVECSWMIEDSKLPTQHGTISIEPDSTSFQGHRITGEMPLLAAGTEPTITVAMTPAGFGRILRGLHESGNTHLFKLAYLLKPYTRAAVESAARRVYREIHDIPGSPDQATIPVIDTVEADVVIDSMMYGRDGQESSMMTRLLRRVAATDAVVCKSVLQFITTAIWSSAETHVRSEIGDPHAGRVIRRLARLINSADPADVLDEYRRLYPKQHMGMNRIVAALTADATVSARQTAAGWV